MSETEDLVAAYRILAEFGVIDAYGHVSVRLERDPNRYLLARSLAPELVTEADILEYDLDSNPINERGRDSVRERFIHLLQDESIAPQGTRRARTSHGSARSLRA